MNPRARTLPLLLPIISLGLAGCNELALRKGPAPILDVTSVQTAATNQGTIIYALAQDAGYAHPEMGGIDYYRVAEAGFNYVDDQCSAYFDTIFFLDRERSQLKSGLAAASSTTAAILGVTNASTLSLSVVASAFGLASAGTDILAGTYLYSLPPATTQGLVNKLQIAYRDAAARTRADITTPTAAYHQIQSYLALCLPPTIETEVANQVNAATAVGVSVAGGSIAVRTGSSLPDRSTIPPSQAVFVAPVSSTHGHIVPLPKEVLINPTGINSFEKYHLFTSMISTLQGALCAKQDGNVDSLRKAMAVFYNKGHAEDIDRATRIEKQGILPADTESKALVDLKLTNQNCKSKLGDPADVGASYFSQ